MALNAFILKSPPRPSCHRFSRRVFILNFRSSAAMMSPIASFRRMRATKDISLPFDKRVADLVGHMTLQEKAEQVQYLTRPNAELDIPGVCWWTEAIHGISLRGNGHGLPAGYWHGGGGIALMHQVGDAIADEARAQAQSRRGTLSRGSSCGPPPSTWRAIRWGPCREETYGEDPYHRPAGGRILQRLAGRRSQVSQDRRDSQAFRRA